MKDLELNNSTLKLSSNTDNNFNTQINFNWSYDNETQFFETTIEQIFKKNNNYLFSVEFKGFLKDDNIGFYRSSYTDDNGDKRWLLTSQFEPVEARKAFICFDEPEMKSTFKLIVKHDNSLNALSNMPIESTQDL